MSVSKLPNVVWACVIGLLLTPSGASADGRMAPRSPHVEESEVIVGLKGVFVREHAEDAVEQGGGLGAFVETTLIEHRLELELGVVGIFPGETAAQAAFEPLLKVSFYPRDSVTPYVGAGPIVLWGEEKPHLRGGGQLAVGSYFWLHPNFGIDLDVAFALLSGTDGRANELTVALGPVARF